MVKVVKTNSTCKLLKVGQTIQAGKIKFTVEYISDRYTVLSTNSMKEAI